MPLTGCDAVRRSEEKYRLLFHSTPIVLIEKDASRLKIYLDRLRESGVSDFEEYLRDNLQETAHCMRMIAERNISREREVTIVTGKGNKRNVLTKALIVSGSEDTLARIVIAMVDTYGHLNGSRAIQEVAGTIQETISAPAFAVALLPFLTMQRSWSRYWPPPVMNCHYS